MLCITFISRFYLAGLEDAIEEPGSPGLGCPIVVRSLRERNYRLLPQPETRLRTRSVPATYKRLKPPRKSAFDSRFTSAFSPTCVKPPSLNPIYEQLLRLIHSP